MSQLHMSDATLPQLFEFVRCESGPVRSRCGTELWLSLPHSHGFPLYTTVRATARLAEFIAGNSIYRDERDLDRSHYLEIVFRDDDTALVILKFQQILGSRWLCIVPQSQVRDWIRGNARPKGAVMSIYQRMVDAGVPIDHHESDLYVPVNETTRALVEAYESRSNVTQFKSNTDGKAWYDIPFAYQPYWDSKPR